MKTWTFTDPSIPSKYSIIVVSSMGSTFKFIHCADLHLGLRFRGLDSVDQRMAERLRRSVFDSFQRIVDKALEERVDAMVISGDLYDDSNELPSTRMWLAQQFSRLKIPIFICRGNHDNATSWDSAISYPENVHIFSTEPESFKIGEDYEILGVSFSTWHETRNLASMIKGDSERFSIACLHCDVDAVSEGYTYAPCSINDMRGSNVDYWALGHIHKRGILSKDPYVVYSGNIQGRSFKETGPKGAYLVTVSSKRIVGFEFFSTSSYVWKDISVDISDRSFNDLITEIKSQANQRSICRITFTGSGELDTMLRTRTDDVRKMIVDSTGCIVSGIIIGTTSPIDIESRKDDKDMGSALVRAGMDIQEMTKEEIVELICQNKVASRYKEYFQSLTEDQIRDIVEDAMRGILARMEASR